jgi:hypothetical protein
MFLMDANAYLYNSNTLHRRTADDAGTVRISEDV